jgi:hypothetical protein
MTNPSAKAEPQLGIIALGFPVLALDIPNPKGDAREILSHARHVGFVCLGTDMDTLKSCQHLFAPPSLKIP